MPIGEKFDVKRWGLNDSVWWFNNVNAVLWCSVMLVSLSAGDRQQQWGNHRSSLSRSSRAPQTFITPVCRCETRMTKLKSQVHESNRPFADVATKKRDYIASHSVMVSLRFFFLRVSSVIDRSLTLQRYIECGRPPFTIIHGSERRVSHSLHACSYGRINY